MQCSSPQREVGRSVVWQHRAWKCFGSIYSRELAGISDFTSPIHICNVNQSWDLSAIKGWILQCDMFGKTLRPFPRHTPPIAILFSSVEETYVFPGYHTSCFWFEFHLQQLANLILFLFLCEVQDSEKQNLPKTRFGDLSEMLLRFWDWAKIFWRPTNFEEPSFTHTSDLLSLINASLCLCSQVKQQEERHIP